MTIHAQSLSKGGFLPSLSTGDSSLRRLCLDGRSTTLAEMKKKPPTEMTVSSLPSSNLDHTHECGVPDQFWPDWRRMRCWPVGTRWPSGFHTAPKTSGCKENIGRCDRFNALIHTDPHSLCFWLKEVNLDLKINGIKWI